MGKTVNYERRREATETALKFMGQLLPHYSAADMDRMWDALELQVNMYGIEFIADSILKSRYETELALQEVM